jgi:dynein heavy chain
MLDVEAQMMGSLKDLAKRALESYPKIQRTEWSKLWPGQIVLAVSQIYWTGEVEQAIKDHENSGLENLYNMLQQQIEDIVLMVRTDLKPMERITIKALVVIDVHARDVVGLLRDADIQNKDDFDWSS